MAGLTFHLSHQSRKLSGLSKSVVEDFAKSSQPTLTLNGNHFVGFVLYDARDVFMKFYFPFGTDHAYAVLNCKNKLDV